MWWKLLFSSFYGEKINFISNTKSPACVIFVFPFLCGEWLWGLVGWKLWQCREVLSFLCLLSCFRAWIHFPQNYPVNLFIHMLLQSGKLYFFLFKNRVIKNMIKTLINFLLNPRSKKIYMKFYFTQHGSSESVNKNKLYFNEKSFHIFIQNGKIIAFHGNFMDYMILILETSFMRFIFRYFYFYLFVKIDQRRSEKW